MVEGTRAIRVDVTDVVKAQHGAFSDSPARDSSIVSSSRSDGVNDGRGSEAVAPRTVRRRAGA
jgi:hypothetical protein